MSRVQHSVALRRAASRVLPFVFVPLVGCGAGGLQSEPHPLLTHSIEPRREMTLDGSLVNIPSPDHVTIIDVWATSCVPCMHMIPGIEALYEKSRAQGLAVVGVATDDNPGLVQQKLAELGVAYPNVVDAEGAVRGALRADKLPTTLVIDKRGRLRVARVGGDGDDLDALRAAVATLLEEP